MWLMCPIKLLQTLPRQLLPVGLWVQIGSVSLLRDSVSRAGELRLAWPAQSRPSRALPNLSTPEPPTGVAHQNIPRGLEAQ